MRNSLIWLMIIWTLPSAALAGTCLNLVLGRGEYSFPAELKMNMDRVQALRGTEYEPLVRLIGRIFHKVSARPALLDREALLTGPEFTAEERGLLKELLVNLKPLEMMPAELSVDPRDERWVSPVKLAYLKTALNVRPRHRTVFEALMTSEFRVILTEEYKHLLRSILSEGFTQPVESYEPTALTAVGALHNLQDLGKRSVVAYSHLRDAKQAAEFLGLRAFMTFYLVVPALSKNHSMLANDAISTLMLDHEEKIMAVAEDFYFKSKYLPVFDRQAFMEFARLILLGSPFPYTSQQVLTALLEGAKTKLLTAKSFLAKEAGRRQAEVEIEQRANIEVTPFILKLVEEKIQHSRKGKEGRLGPVLVDVTESTEQPDTLKPFTKYVEKRSDLSELKPEVVYRTKFLRDAQGREQQIRFTSDVVKAMNHHRDEAYQALDGLVVGFVDNHHHGAGVKHLTDMRTTRDHKPIYEARPNRGGYRFLLLKRDGVWDVLSFVHKSDFDHEVERIRSL